MSLAYFWTIFPSDASGIRTGKRVAASHPPDRALAAASPESPALARVPAERAEGNGPAFNVNRHARLIRGRKERKRPKAKV